VIEAGPCLQSSPWLIAFNATLNVVQAVLLAALAQRAVRKNREDREAKDEQSK